MIRLNIKSQTISWISCSKKNHCSSINHMVALVNFNLLHNFPLSSVCNLFFFFVFFAAFANHMIPRLVSFSTCITMVFSNSVLIWLLQWYFQILFWYDYYNGIFKFCFDMIITMVFSNSVLIWLLQWYFQILFWYDYYNGIFKFCFDMIISCCYLMGFSFPLEVSLSQTFSWHMVLIIQLVFFPFSLYIFCWFFFITFNLDALNG